MLEACAFHYVIRDTLEYRIRGASYSDEVTTLVAFKVL